MNLNAEGMSWFGNIWRKFESVCLDVDEIVNHETIKYIEKVQNVRENVMKFYSKLAEVIVSPVMDPDMSEEEEDAVISYFKSLMKIEEHFVDNLTYMPALEQVEVAFEPEKNQLKNQLVHKSDDFEETTYGDSATECFLPTSSYIEALFSSTASIHDPTHVASTEIICNEIGSNMVPNKAFAVYYNAIHNDAINIIKGNYDYITSQINSDGNYCSSFASSMESFGSSDDYSSCKTTGFNKEADDLSHQVELEESCVIVDYTTPHVNVSSKAPKQPSYKRMIMEALSSKKRLAREYKELAILEGHNATKCCQGTSMLAPHTMLLRDSQTIQSSDSEWELL